MGVPDSDWESESELLMGKRGGTHCHPIGICKGGYPRLGFGIRVGSACFRISRPFGFPIWVHTNHVVIVVVVVVVGGVGVLSLLLVFVILLVLFLFLFWFPFCSFSLFSFCSFFFFNFIPLLFLYFQCFIFPCCVFSCVLFFLALFGAFS